MKKSARLIMNAHHVTVFTSACISVESGIPPFRCETGLWSKYNPIVLDIDCFHSRLKESWEVIKEIFYDFFGEPIPEPANSSSFSEAERADVFLLIGTTGEIMPASLIPHQAKRNGSKIIEINVEQTKFAESITNIFLEEKLRG